MYKRFSGCTALSMLVLCASTAQAQVVLSDDHIDIAIAYSAGAFDLHISRDSDGAEWAPNASLVSPSRPQWARFFGGPNTITPRPAGSQFDFIGVGSGQPFFNLPDVQVPNKIYLGFGLDDFDPTGVASYHETDSRVDGSTAQPWIHVAMKAVRGPAGGQFSMWQNGLTGPTVWLASSDGITASDAAIMVPGADFHGNWGLTVAGTYEVDFQASIFTGLDGTGNPINPIFSPITTYVFETSAVPEPSSLLFTTACLGIAGAWRRRRSRARSK